MAIPWGPIIAGVGQLGAGWLLYKGAGKAGDRQLSASEQAEESARQMHAQEMLLNNRRYNSSMAAMLARAGTNYGTFKLPILNQLGTGWPSQQQYTASLGSGWNPMSDEDLNWLMKHGSASGGPPESGVKV